jgi:phospholipid/cholesterol/gamma-HCH transport system substrate-binding protein
MKRQFVEIAVGLFVIAGFVALLFLSLSVSSLNRSVISNSYQVSAKFDNIGGLQVRAPVTMAGVKIGRVNEIQLDSDSYQANVVMDISGEYEKLPVDTSASIYTQGLLGEQFVSLEPGGEQTYLKEGDRIRLTQSAVILENLIGQLLFNNSAKGAMQ